MYTCTCISGLIESLHVHVLHFLSQIWRRWCRQILMALRSVITSESGQRLNLLNPVNEAHVHLFRCMYVLLFNYHIHWYMVHTCITTPILIYDHTHFQAHVLPHPFSFTCMTSPIFKYMYYMYLTHFQTLVLPHTFSHTVICTRRILYTATYLWLQSSSNTTA